MPDDKNRIAAIVILYNPEYDVIENVKSFRNVISYLYVFDNSERKDERIYNEIISIYGESVHFHFNQGNAGIGFPLNQGVDWAKRDGFNWLLTMDQDTFFNEATYFEAFHKYAHKEDVAVFTPNQLFTTKPEFGSYYAEEVMIAMTSGSLINLSLFDIIGPFNDTLFIDEIDHEYCLRARKKGFRILKFPNIQIVHHLGKSKFVVKGKQRYFTAQHPPLRVYYITRNNLYIYKTYVLTFPAFIFLRVKNLTMLFRDILLYHDHKLQKFKYALLGLFHFIIGRYGKL